tara:strand:- start:3 stop:1793 length:1791 start_codon:yes stop_codon:yes gene_type:complete
MCGIFALLNNTSTLNPEDVKMAFELGNNRGPEDSEFIKYDNSIDIGFKRLAINGLNKLSRQPMTIDNITLICNGEIYNYKELFKEINVTPTTQSDCEIIIHLYKKYGIRHTLMLLDGYFAFILYDYRTENSEPQFIVARDPFGVRPLFILEQNHIQDENKHNNNHITHENIIGFASELKMLNPLLNSKKGLLTYSKPTIPYPKQVTGIKPSFTISQYPPGCYSVYKISYSLNSEWINDVKNVSYHYQRHIKNIATNSYSKEIHNETLLKIYNNLNNAVKKRVKGTTERPIACLLSGGLDSSLITALVNKYHEGQLDTFSIGMEGSEDLKYAKEVANYLDTNHTEIVLTPDEFFDAIPDVIRTIESYDTTTVRASVGNYLVGKYISENTDIKVVFNGDGSDELTGGYLYFLKAPNALEFDSECRRLINEIHFFDCLRSDRCIAAHGLEPRTPFLDRTFVDEYFTFPLCLRYPQYLSQHTKETTCEKMLLRQAIFKHDKDLLPIHILQRKKEAFSDGVSGNSGSWFSIIGDKVSNYNIDNSVITDYQHNTPQTKEQLYYRKIYDELYPNTAKTIPYFWMPKYVNAKDASARTLDFYNE